jgi:hypothetical protein
MRECDISELPLHPEECTPAMTVPDASAGRGLVAVTYEDGPPREQQGSVTPATGLAHAAGGHLEAVTGHAAPCGSGPP